MGRQFKYASAQNGCRAIHLLLEKTSGCQVPLNGDVVEIPIRRVRPIRILKTWWPHLPPMRDEDFIGRYSKISRTCHYPSIHPSIYLSISFYLSISLQDPPNRGGQRHQGASPFYIESKEVGFKIQDSRLRKNFLNPRLQDSTKKISNPRGVGFKIQDSRLRKKLLESKEVGFKIQDSKREFLNPRGKGSRFIIQGSDKTSWVQGDGIQDSRLRFQKRILDSKDVGSRFKIQSSEKTCSTPRR